MVFGPNDLGRMNMVQKEMNSSRTKLRGIIMICISNVLHY